MKNFFRNYTSEYFENLKEDTKELQKRKKQLKQLKEILEKHFNFEIQDYIVDDILDYEKYHHICSMISLAVINNRLSKENGENLKNGLKELFKIKDSYERVNPQLLLNNFDYDKWLEEYNNKEKIDLKKYLKEDDIKILKALGIEIKDKIYTECEFEYTEMNLVEYYIDEYMEKDEIDETKPLPEGITREEYNRILDLFQKISDDYNL